MTNPVDCPVCGAPVRWTAESRWRPFCSERCKLVDLGDWAAGRHAIPGLDGEADNEGDDPGAGAPSRRND